MNYHSDKIKDHYFTVTEIICKGAFHKVFTYFSLLMALIAVLWNEMNKKILQSLETCPKSHNYQFCLQIILSTHTRSFQVVFTAQTPLPFSGHLLPDDSQPGCRGPCKAARAVLEGWQTGEEGETRSPTPSSTSSKAMFLGGRCPLQQRAYLEDSNEFSRVCPCLLVPLTPTTRL
jgi:hypothetical protein